MSGRRVFVLAAVLGVTGVAAALFVLRSPDAGAPSAPPRVTLLHLRTQLPNPPSLFGNRACTLALAPPVTMAVERDQVVFRAVDDGRLMPLVFPAGFTASLDDRDIVLVAPEGVVVARQGDILTGLGGAASSSGEMLVCFTGPHEYRDVVEQSSP